MKKIDFVNLMELAAERIAPYIPEHYEMDNLNADNHSEIFQIDIYDSRKLTGGPSARLRFYRQAGETDEELMERYDEEVKDFQNDLRGWED